MKVSHKNHVADSEVPASHSALCVFSVTCSPSQMIRPGSQSHQTRANCHTVQLSASRNARRREVLAAAMRGAGVAGSLSMMLHYDAATPLVETQAQASLPSTLTDGLTQATQLSPHPSRPLKGCPGMSTVRCMCLSEPLLACQRRLHLMFLNGSA